MKESVIQIYRERRVLFNSLRDLSQSVGALNRILLVFCFIVTSVIALAIFGISLSGIVPYAGLLGSLSFIFGPSANITFQGALFTFVMHTFDVGDLVCIDGTTYKVLKVKLLMTKFINMDGQLLYIPNSILIGKPIINYRRSPDQWEGITFQVDFNTSETQLRELARRIEEFTKSKPREWMPGCSVSVISINDMTGMTVCLGMTHKGNWQDCGRRWTRRTEIYFEVQRTLQDMKIKYTLPARPILLNGTLGNFSPEKLGDRKSSEGDPIFQSSI
ncbi:Mechanosensitive ion channel-domain-containing protein [Polychytrium aggregatum]|uniref:Mechanosensitive ion channel-domain-containing protein n=1 Tax=Polychytrium aggregatum TaxID=110093 RepID=UPI0022FE98B9|nr:Mechanosensitive ion channel-domain-containing protein [Polychytrium aggregatum]KAI9204583.1 Mechanosensitive ion channel-domain-containing protein [Polychytrium aggregatum]